MEPEPEIIHEEVENIIGFIEQIRSHRRLNLKFREATIPFAAHIENPHISWVEVHDGEEITLRDLESLIVCGAETTILCKPRYGWVFSFLYSRDIVIRNITLGHVSDGYCSGGVLFFSECRDVSINDCELFGSGTYGFELTSVENASFLNLDIHSCSYGLGNITRSKGIKFNNCLFHESGQFDFLTIDDLLDDIIFYDCVFSDNNSESGQFICFHSLRSTNNKKVRFINCTFRGNKSPTLSNYPELVRFHDCEFLMNGFEHSNTLGAE